MNKIVWKSEYNTGITTIDEQHRKLLALINELLELNDKKHEFEVLRKVIFEIADYTQYHFKSEEEHMKSTKYPGYEKHIGEHRKLVEKIIVMLNNMKNGKIDIKEDLEKLLVGWFIDHVTHNDINYSKYVKENFPKLVK